MTNRYLVAAAPLIAAAGALGAVADFQDGTTQGFNQNFPNAVDTIADAGPAGVGDFALLANANPNQLKLFPSTQTNADFLGDFIARDIIRVQFDAMNPASNADSLEMHAAAFNGPGNRWISNTGEVVPNDGQWRTFTIDFTQSDVTQALGGNSFATDFANITQFGLRHQLNASDFGGAPLSSGNNSVMLDNIRLIPTPPTACLAGAGLVLANRRRRR